MAGCKLVVSIESSSAPQLSSSKASCLTVPFSERSFIFSISTASLSAIQNSVMVFRSFVKTRGPS